MKINYLIKRILSFIIDVIFFYGWGIIIYFSLDYRSIPSSFSKVTLSLTILTFVVIISIIFSSMTGGSIGQKLLGLKSHYYRLKYGKFIPALLKSLILFIFIIPVITPPVFLIVHTSVFLFFSIKTYIKEKRLFIDVITGIDIIEREKVKGN